MLLVRRLLVVLFFALLAVLAVRSAAHAPDFPVYHRAARHIIEGDFRLYPDEAYAGHPVPSQGFRYAPALAVLFVPFGLLPVQWASVVFFFVQVGAIWWMGRTTACRAGAPAWTVTAFMTAFLLAGGYLVEDLRFGNAHILCMALMLVAWDDAESGRVVRPSAALAVAILMKLTPVVLLGYFALRRRFALCVVTLGLVAAMLVAPIAFVGRDVNARELRAFTAYALEKADENDNYALRGAFVRYLTPLGVDQSHLPTAIADVPMPIVEGLSLAANGVLGLLALLVVFREDDDRVTRLLEFSLVLAGMIIASPHTQRRYFVALYVPAVVLLGLWHRTRDARERRLAQWGLGAIVLPGTVLPLVFGGRRLALVYEATSPYLIGVLTLFFVLLLLTRHRKVRTALEA